MEIACILKVELPLDAAAGVVGDLVVTVGGGNGDALGLDQLGLQPRVLGDRAAVDPLVGRAEILGSPVSVAAAQRLDRRGGFAGGGEGVEFGEHGLDPLEPCRDLGRLGAGCLALALLSQAEGTADRRQQRTLPISVAMMTTKVTNRIRSRSGNGAPLTSSGIASAAANETAPRIPVKPIRNGIRQLGTGSRRRSAGKRRGM